MAEVRSEDVKVLVVEDEPRLRELLVEVLPEMGFVGVGAVRSGEEAVKRFESDPADVLLLDLHLPGMSGLELFERLRGRWPDVQVIVLTAYGDLEAARRAIRLDVVDFLSKPFHLSDIEQAMDRARRRVVERRSSGVDEPVQPGPTLADAERAAILTALRRHGGNRTAAAEELGISRRKLHYWLAENGET